MRKAARFETPKLVEALAGSTFDFVPRARECGLCQIRLYALSPLFPCRAADAAVFSQEDLLVRQIDVLEEPRERVLKLGLGNVAAQQDANGDCPSQFAILAREIVFEIGNGLPSATTDGTGYSVRAE